jgi:hypothetical protein
MSRRSRLGRALLHLLFLGAAAACIALLALNVLAWRGSLVEEPSPDASPAEKLATESTAAASSRQAAAPAPTLPHAWTLPAAPAAIREPETPTISIVAARGPSWIAARAGSADGPPLWEGILDVGQSVSFDSSRVWLRLGAAGNLDLVVDGKPVRDLWSGTLDVLATSSGVRPASGGA